MPRTFVSALLILLQTQPVKTGIDVLARDGFAPLQGKRVGLVTNHTGRGAAGTSTIDLLASAKGVTLAALFSPEHGIRGEADAKVAGGRDAKTGLPIHSLYGKTTKPTAEMLKDVDVLVYDIQDVGARFYTYITTLALVMEAAKENDTGVVVLDRPNPIGGEAVEGPILEDALRGDFIGYFPIPMRHGLTIGELATLYNTEFKIGCRLEVVKMEGWKRPMYFDETGLPWVNPSPNMRSLAAAISYPGLGALEATSLSVGRGTGRAFVLYGAPWIDGKKLGGDRGHDGTIFLNGGESTLILGEQTSPFRFFPSKRGGPTAPEELMLHPSGEFACPRTCSEGRSTAMHVRPPFTR